MFLLLLVKLHLAIPDPSTLWTRKHLQSVETFLYHFCYLTACFLCLTLFLPNFPPVSLILSAPFPGFPAESLYVPLSPPSGYVRGRSNSLRVDDILMRRSNSLRFGLEGTPRKINSFEELGINPLTPLTRDERTGSIKIPTNGSIGLEVI